MKIAKIIYWLTTILLCVLMLYSAGMYFTKYDMVKGFFDVLGHPTYIIYPLAVLKILGVAMIVWRKNNWLTEWAYAGIFFNAVLATAAHEHANHGIGLSHIAIPIILTSYFLGKLVRSNE